MHTDHFMHSKKTKVVKYHEFTVRNNVEKHIRKIYLLVKIILLSNKLVDSYFIGTCIPIKLYVNYFYLYDIIRLLLPLLNTLMVFGLYWAKGKLA